jgi:hypothetical protein
VKLGLRSISKTPAVFCHTMRAEEYFVVVEVALAADEDGLAGDEDALTLDKDTLAVVGRLSASLSKPPRTDVKLKETRIKAEEERTEGGLRLSKTVKDGNEQLDEKLNKIMALQQEMQNIHLLVPQQGRKRKEVSWESTNQD